MIFVSLQSPQVEQSSQVPHEPQASVSEQDEQSLQFDMQDEQLDAVFEQAAEALKDKNKRLSSTIGITCFVRMYNTGL
jgi:hypothetical protein